jgi:phosphate transport system substrate-binding protein
VRAIPLARQAGKDFVSASPENAISGTCPLSRFLYVYVNKAPGQPLPPLTEEFIRLVLSRAGQEVVVKDGYIPLPAGVAERELLKTQ